jgi:hypothetical protein
MINTSKKLALIAVLAAMSVASPALAQSFDKSSGTGNELPFAYGPGGTKPAWTVPPQNEQIAVRQSNAGKVAVRQTGRNAFAAVPGRGMTTPRFRLPPAPMPQTARRPPAAAAPATMRCFCETEASTKTGAS